MGIAHGRGWILIRGAVLLGIAVMLVFGQVSGIEAVSAAQPKSRPTPWTSWGELKQQVKCRGRFVKAFTAKDAGDSPRSNPVPIILRTAPHLARYEKALCVETSGGMPYRKSLEWVQLKNGLSVAISNEGFESYGLGFYWVLPPDSQPFSNKPYWLKRSTALLKTLLPMLAHPLDRTMLKDGVQMVQGHLQRNDPLALENTVLDNGQEIATRVFWDKMRSLPGGRKAIQITVAVGPL